MRQEDLNAIGFLLIKECQSTNATTMKLTLENVTYLEKPLGYWRVTVEQIKPPTP